MNKNHNSPGRHKGEVVKLKKPEEQFVTKFFCTLLFSTKAKGFLKRSSAKIAAELPNLSRFQL